MFGAPINNGLTLTKVLGGLSKTLTIANQVIPLYKEAKPMIHNARNILSVLKEFNSGNGQPNVSKNQSNQSQNNTQEKNTYEENQRVYNGNPSFFL